MVGLRPGNPSLLSSDIPFRVAKENTFVFTCWTTAEGAGAVKIFLHRADEASDVGAANSEELVALRHADSPTLMWPGGHLGPMLDAQIPRRAGPDLPVEGAVNGNLEQWDLSPAPAQASRPSCSADQA